MINTKFLDSSIWIAYIFGTGSREIIESDVIIHTSVLSIFEVKRKLQRENLSQKKINLALNLIKKRAIIHSLDIDLAELASDLANEHKLHAADSIIYASSRKINAPLITMDSDFKGLLGVELVN